jgi:tetratricopeptide (TPR) repeat protein
MAHSSQFLAIWSRAKKQYAEVTGDDMDDPTFPHPSSIQDLETFLDEKNNKFDDFRKKRGMVFATLNGVCKPIQLLGGIAAGGAALAFPPSSLCFGAITYLINAARGVSASYDAIVDLMGTLKDFLVRLTVYNREGLSSEIQEKLAEILTTLLEVFARSTKMVRRGFGGRLLSMGKNVLLGNDEKLDDLVSRLNRMTVSESHLVGAETFTESKRMGRKVDEVSATLTETNMAVIEGNRMVGDVSFGVQQMSLKQDHFHSDVRKEIRSVVAALDESRIEASQGGDRKHIDKVKAVLQPSVFPIDTYTGIEKTRVPGTGDWIRKEELFQAWVHQDNPLLLVSGNPGSGKTYLSGNMICFLEEQHPQGVQHTSHTSIGYFFFKNNDPRTRSFQQALKDLAYQISLNDPIYAKHIGSNIQSTSEIETVESAWRRLFRDYFIEKEGQDSKAYLVLDGVDEALDSERAKFLKLLVDLQEARSSNSRGSSIHLVMVGQPQIIHDIEEILGGSGPTIHVNYRKNSEDIIDYVKASIKKSKKLSATKKDLQEEVVETLAKRAEGMFTWVDLMMRELGKKSRASSIRESLHHAPTGLHDMLRHVLEGFSFSLEEEDAEDLNLLLTWVTCVVEPLSLEQLDTILRLKSPEGDGVLLLEGKLRGQFASFFTLVREDGLSTADLQAEKPQSALSRETGEAIGDDGFDSNPWTTKVVFSHASIGDFFRDNEAGKAQYGHDNPRIGVNIVEAKVYVLNTCLDLICNPELPGQINERRKMLDYVQYFWPFHLGEALKIRDKIDPTKQKETGRMLVQMLRDETPKPRMAFYFNWDFFASTALISIRAWLEHPDVLHGLADGDRQWVESTKSNPAESYVPAARVSAAHWLQRDSFYSKFCMLEIHTIMNFVRGGADGDIPNPEAHVPVSVIMNAAEWPQLEKTALWHRRLAECFQIYKHYDEAMEHFQIALDMDAEMWQARDGIAFIYGYQRREYDKAVELWKLNDSVFEGFLAREPKPKEGDKSYCTNFDRASTHAYIAVFYRAKGDQESSLRYYKTAIEFDKPRCAYVAPCINMLAVEMKNPSKIISLLKDLDFKVPGEKLTRLTNVIGLNFEWDEAFFVNVSAAAETVNELPWLIEAYETAAATSRNIRRSALATAVDVCTAELYLAAGHKKEKVARVWERIIKIPMNPGTMEDSRIRISKDFVAARLSVYYLDKAQELEHGTAEEREWIQKLERLCKAKQKATDDAPQVVTASSCAIRLGLWYREHGHLQEANTCFQPFIKEALMILSDDDLENDGDGFHNLASALVAAGDDECTLAVLRSLRPMLRASCRSGGYDSDGDDSEGWRGKYSNAATALGGTGDEDMITNGEETKHDNVANGETGETGRDSAVTSPETASSSVSYDEFPDSDLMRRMYARYPCHMYRWPWLCKGPCNRRFPIFAEANMCRMCSVQLCDQCLKLLKSGDKRTRRICNPKHAWLHVDAPEHEVDEDQVLIGEEVISLEEFKERLRVKWKV